MSGEVLVLLDWTVGEIGALVAIVPGVVFMVGIIIRFGFVMMVAMLVDMMPVVIGLWLIVPVVRLVPMA